MRVCVFARTHLPSCAHAYTHDTRNIRTQHTHTRTHIHILSLTLTLTHTLILTLTWFWFWFGCCGCSKLSSSDILYKSESGKLGCERLHNRYKL